jgi:hypothetical protein
MSNDILATKGLHWHVSVGQLVGHEIAVIIRGSLMMCARHPYTPKLQQEVRCVSPSSLDLQTKLFFANIFPVVKSKWPTPKVRAICWFAIMCARGVSSPRRSSMAHRHDRRCFDSWAPLDACGFFLSFIMHTSLLPLRQMFKIALASSENL